MQATARLHNYVPYAILQEADGILHDPIAFDSPNSMFDADFVLMAARRSIRLHL